MLTNFIYSQSKGLFLEQLQAGNVPEDAIAFLEDSGEIWNRNHYFGTTDVSNLLTEGKLIGTITANNNPYNIYAPATYAWSDITGTENVLTTAGGEIVGSFDAFTINRNGGGAVSSIAFKYSDSLLYGYLGFDNVNNPMWMDSANNRFSLIHEGNYFKYALPLTGGTIGNRLTISSESDAKIILNETGTDVKYQQIAFQDNGVEYGRLGTYGDDQLKWTGKTLIHSGNFSDYAVKYDGGASIDAARHSIGYDNGGHGSVNLPKVGGYISFGHDTYGGQILGTPNGLGLFYRGVVNNVFSDWKTIAFTDSDITGNAASASKIVDNNYNYIFHYGDSAVYLNYGSLSTRSTKIYGKTIDFISGASATTAMLINSSGNVTIGASDLALTTTKLYVDGGIRFSPRTLWGQSFDGTGNVGGTLSGVNNIYMNEGYRFYIGGVDSLYLYPSQKTIYIGYGAGTTYATAIAGNEVSLRYGGLNTGFILNSSGNVTIGSQDYAGTGYRLWVNGPTNVEGNLRMTGELIFAGGYSIQSYNNAALSLNPQGNNILLSPNGYGNVLIGTTEDNGSGAKLQVAGDITINGISLLEKLTNIEQSSDTLEDYVQENRSKSTEAINTANVAKNAVATLEGLANATTAQTTLAATVTQIEQNTTDIKVLQDMYVLMSVAEYEALEIKDSDKIYMLYEE